MSSTELTPDWLDEVAVMRAVHGHDVGRPLTTAEKREAAQRMYQANASHEQISARLGVSGATLAELLGLKQEAKR